MITYNSMEMGVDLKSSLGKILVEEKKVGGGVCVLG